MRYLIDQEAEDAERYCGRAAQLAQNSNCKKGKHGVVLVKKGKVIGEGWNTPVPDEPCEPCLRENIHGHDLLELCNAIHAEHNAFDNAASKGYDVSGAIAYHARLKDGEVVRKNEPSCLSCGKLVLHKGLEGFVLMQGENYVFYPADEFKKRSFDYHLKKRQ